MERGYKKVEWKSDRKKVRRKQKWMNEKKKKKTAERERDRYDFSSLGK